MGQKYCVSKTLFLHEKTIIEKNLSNIKTDIDFSSHEHADLIVEHTFRLSSKLPTDAHKLGHIFCEILGLGALPPVGDTVSLGKDMPGDHGRRYYAKLNAVSDHAYHLSLRCRVSYEGIHSKDAAAKVVVGLGHEMQSFFKILTDKAHRLLG